MNSGIGNKGDIPVLVDPRTRKSEYVNPMDIVLYTKENGEPFTVKKLCEEHITLINNHNKLLEILMNK